MLRQKCLFESSSLVSITLYIDDNIFIKYINLKQNNFFQNILVGNF